MNMTSTAGPVIVFGGANIDVKARIEGHAVEGTSNYGAITRSPGGVGRNIAENLARLGVPVQLVAALGDDADGDDLIAATSSAGVDCSLVVRPGGATGCYVAVLDPTGDLVVGVNAMRITEAITAADILARSAAIERASMVVADANLDDETLIAVAMASQRLHRPLAVEPVSDFKANRVLALLDHLLPIYLLTPNRSQLGRLVGRRIGGQAEIAGAVAELHARGVELIIVGLGADGCYASDGRHRAFVPAIATAAEDVTGGGDAAFAAALWALRGGHDIGRAARLGQAAASLAVADDRSVAREMTPERLLAIAGEG